MLLLAAACSSKQPRTVAKPVTGPGVTTTLDKVWLLEASGATVRDTSVAFLRSSGRTIVLRHPEADEAIFLIVEFSPVRDTTRMADSVHIRLHPVAGRYQFALTTQDKIGAGVRATFSYAIHFRTPAEAVAKYPSPGRLAQLIAPAEIAPDGKVRFLAGERPAADMLRFSLTVPGTYGLVAPR